MSKNFLFLHNLSIDEVHSKGQFIGNFSTKVNNTYSVWIMEKGKLDELIVLIHEDDNEVAGILDARTSKIIYLHPRSIDGAMKLWNI